MAAQVALALGAGLTSGLLYGAMLAGNALAMLLFYLAPLPVMIAALGWGRASGLIAAAAAAITAGAILTPQASLYYLATCGAPAVWLGHLAMLSRPGDKRGEEGAEAAGDVEWYPPGRLVAHAAMIACALAAGAALVIGPDGAGYRETTEAFVAQLIELQPGVGEELAGAEDLDELAAYLAGLLLPGFAMVWLVAILANLWAAARVLNTSGRLARPWPAFITLDIPPPFAAFFAVCALAMLAPGIVGIVAAAATAAWMVAYMLVGLTVLHAATLGMTARAMLLAALYFALVAFVVAGFLVALIGLTEPLHKIRARALAQHRAQGPD